MSLANHVTAGWEALRPREKYMGELMSSDMSVGMSYYNDVMPTHVDAVTIHPSFIEIAWLLQNRKTQNELR